MALERLSLASISTVDEGRIKEAFDQALRRIQGDCVDRPTLEGDRTLVLKITVAPVADERGNLDSCDVRFHIEDKLPARKSKTYNAKAKHGALFFNELSPDDVHQATIDEVRGPSPLTGT